MVTRYKESTICICFSIYCIHESAESHFIPIHCWITQVVLSLLTFNRGTGEWDSVVPLNAHPLLLKEKTLFYSGHLNWIVLQPALEMWHLKGCMLKIKAK
jgi:hypothetical protein